MKCLTDSEPITPPEPVTMQTGLPTPSESRDQFRSGSGPAHEQSLPTREVEVRVPLSGRLDGRWRDRLPLLRRHRAHVDRPVAPTTQANVGQWLGGAVVDASVRDDEVD